jgi:hypothetical protein
MLDSVNFQFASSYNRFCILVASDVLQATRPMDFCQGAQFIGLIDPSFYELVD